MNTSALDALPKNLSVAITVLGGRETLVTGFIVEIAGTNMFLKSVDELPAGRSVKVEAEDTLWLAEVLRCERVDGEYAVTLSIAHALHGLGDLARLAEQLLDKPTRVQPLRLTPSNSGITVSSGN